MNTKTQPNPTELPATIKLGIDAHAKWFYVACQLDCPPPQPVQKMTFGGLLRFIPWQEISPPTHRLPIRRRPRGRRGGEGMEHQISEQTLTVLTLLMEELWRD